MEGPQRRLSDPMAASYLSLHLWAQAIRASGGDDPVSIRKALVEQRIQAPEGEVRIDPSTQHAWKLARIAKLVSTAGVGDGLPQVVEKS